MRFNHALARSQNRAVPTNTTKDCILDVAERLFAAHGFEGTSLRKIMAQAGVNPAAVHYHFGSKEVLIEEILNRRLTPLNQTRLRLLEEIETRAGYGPLAVKKVLEAFIAPALRLSQDPEHGGAVFMQLVGRFYHETGEYAQQLLREHFGEVQRRFAKALQRAVPELSLQELSWRFHFLFGALSYTMVDRSLVAWISEGRCDPANLDEAVNALVEFAAAGFAPSVSSTGKRKKPQ